MAEFCKECFQELLPDWDITEISEDEELCEGCEKYKPIVIYAEPKINNE